MDILIGLEWLELPFNGRGMSQRNRFFSSDEDVSWAKFSLDHKTFKNVTPDKKKHLETFLIDQLDSRCSIDQLSTWIGYLEKNLAVSAET